MSYINVLVNRINKITITMFEAQVKSFFWPPSEGDPAKNLYARSERVTLSCSHLGLV